MASSCLSADGPESTYPECKGAHRTGTGPARAGGQVYALMPSVAAAGRKILNVDGPWLAVPVHVATRSYSGHDQGIARNGGIRFIAEGNGDGSPGGIHAGYVGTLDRTRIGQCGRSVVGGKGAFLVEMLGNGNLGVADQGEPLGYLRANRIVLICGDSNGGRMPIIATTIISSIKVNPRWRDGMAKLPSWLFLEFRGILFTAWYPDARIRPSWFLNKAI